jgi:hypothetical protein
MVRSAAHHLLLLLQQLWGWGLCAREDLLGAPITLTLSKEICPPIPGNLSKLLVARKAHKRYTSDIRKALAALGAYNC